MELPPSESVSNKCSKYANGRMDRFMNITRHHEGKTRVHHIQCIAITTAHLR